MKTQLGVATYLLALLVCSCEPNRTTLGHTPEHRVLQSANDYVMSSREHLVFVPTSYAPASTPCVSKHHEQTLRCSQRCYIFYFLKQEYAETVAGGRAAMPAM